MLLGIIPHCKTKNTCKRAFFIFNQEIMIQLAIFSIIFFPFHLFSIQWRFHRPATPDTRLSSIGNFFTLGSTQKLINTLTKKKILGKLFHIHRQTRAYITRKENTSLSLSLLFSGSHSQLSASLICLFSSSIAMVVNLFSFTLKVISSPSFLPFFLV